MATGRVEVINSRGCSRLLIGFSSSLPPSVNGLRSLEPMSPASVASTKSGQVQDVGPFAGLVICVTGLSKEARKQVMAATERLGGQYSSNLHPQCTHLVVQSFGGRKFEHALRHGSRTGLLIVTLGWFVDSVRRNVRLSESLYSVNSAGETGSPTGELNRLVGFTDSENSCLPIISHGEKKTSSIALQTDQRFPGKESNKSRAAVLANHSIYIDPDISSELHKKVVEAATREGATVVDHWYIGCNASHVVCEGPSIQRYIGHTNSLVTPLWILKTVKEPYAQRLVHLSADLARQVAMILENVENDLAQDTNGHGGRLNDSLSEEPPKCRKMLGNIEERQRIVDLAKIGVRNRRGRRMQSCEMPIRPLTPASLMDSICWSVSDPTSAACIYSDVSNISLPGSEIEDAIEHSSLFFDARGEGKDLEISGDNNFTRPLRESEKSEVIFKNEFLTILFPVDRFSEMGPSARTFFCDSGFTRSQVLDHIYAFYQENMSANEIQVAIHTDSKHADRLRSVLSKKESSEFGFIPFKRIDFLGSRRSFEMLKRVSGENNCCVYELLIRA